MSSSPFGIRFQPTDANGRPFPGALLNSYQAGTSTPQALYSDSGLSVLTANPLQADSRGAFPIHYLLDGTTYKFALTDAAGNTLGTWDNVYGTALSSGAVVDATSSSSVSAVEGTNTSTGIGVEGDTAGGTGYALAGTGNATKGPLHLGPLATDPSSPTQGDIYPSSVTGKWSFYDGAAWERLVAQIQGITAAESKVLGNAYTASAASLGGNTVRAGTTIRIKGVLSVTAVTTNHGTINILLQIAGVTVLTIPLAYASPPTFSTSTFWLVDIEITIATTGAGGMMNIAGQVVPSDSLGPAAAAVVGAAINTTIANTIQLSTTVVTASASASLEIFNVDVSA